jgi:hypothetical protein
MYERARKRGEQIEFALIEPRAHGDCGESARAAPAWWLSYATLST